MTHLELIKKDCREDIIVKDQVYPTENKFVCKKISNIIKRKHIVDESICKRCELGSNMVDKISLKMLLWQVMQKELDINNVNDFIDSDEKISIAKNIILRGVQFTQDIETEQQMINLAKQLNL